MTLQSTQQLRQTFRQEMPVVQRYAYFDHAAVAPIPRRTAESIRKFADQSTHQGDTMWAEWASSLEGTRRNAAAMLSCNEAEIALVSNTTQGIGFIAEGMPWQAGDNVLVPENEFPSNLLPWRNLARRGVQLKLLPVGRGGEITVEQLRQFIDARTRMVSISWVGFSSGYRCDLQSIVDYVHSQGSLVFLDAIQGLGAFPLDVQLVPVDFVAADGHKWMLGPEGAGLLYIRQKNLEQLQPLGIGWNSLATAQFESESTALKTTAARYEGGSHNMVGMIGFGKSLDLLLEFDCNSPTSLVQQAISENVRELEEKLIGSGWAVDIPHLAQHRSGIIGVRLPEGESSNERVYMSARKYLLDREVVVSMRGGKLRVSTHAYNNSEDIDRLVDALREFRSTQL